MLLGALYSAGVLFFVSRWLSRGGPAIAAPSSLNWAAAGLTPFATVAVGIAGARWIWVRHRGGRLEATVRAEYHASQPHARRRAVDVARARAFHEFMEEHALSTVGWVGVVALTGVVALIALSTAYETVESTGWADWAALALAGSADLGTWLALGLMAGLLALAGIVYRAGPLRRSISVVWDLATFWPRACHPFAPPGYAERCVPQLVTRICGDDERRGFLLAGHSQGSLVCLATVLQLPEARRQQVGLLTFGTQLNRLYGRAFAAFVGPATLHRTASLLHADGGPLRWRSFYRLTDPLGYPVDVTASRAQSTPLIVDAPGRGTPEPLLDPAALAPPPGEIGDPAMHRHSDYLPDHAYACARDELAASLAEPR